MCTNTAHVLLLQHTVLYGYNTRCCMAIIHGAGWLQHTVLYGRNRRCCMAVTHSAILKYVCSFSWAQTHVQMIISLINYYSNYLMKFHIVLILNRNKAICWLIESFHWVTAVLCGFLFQLWALSQPGCGCTLGSRQFQICVTRVQYPILSGGCRCAFGT